MTAVSNAGKHIGHGEAVLGADGERRTLLCAHGELAHAAPPGGLISPQCVCGGLLAGWGPKCGSLTIYIAFKSHQTHKLKPCCLDTQEQGLANFFQKGPDSEHLCLCGPHCHNHSILAQV